MNLSKKLVAAILAMAASASTQAAFVADITDSGVYSDSVATADGWVTNSPVVDGVDFWRLIVTEASYLSVELFSDLDFGISIYKGAVSDEIGFAFDNAASFTDPNTSAFGTFLAGTPSYGEAGSLLSDIFLESAGEYTIAVGGDGFGFSGPYNYDMQVEVAPVPLPGGFGLAALGASMLMMLRRRRSV